MGIDVNEQIHYVFAQNVKGGQHVHLTYTGFGFKYIMGFSHHATVDLLKVNQLLII